MGVRLSTCMLVRRRLSSTSCTAESKFCAQILGAFKVARLISFRLRTCPMYHAQLEATPLFTVEAGQGLPTKLRLGRLL